MEKGIKPSVIMLIHAVERWMIQICGYEKIITHWGDATKTGCAQRRVKLCPKSKRYGIKNRINVLLFNGYMCMINEHNCLGSTIFNFLLRAEGFLMRWAYRVCQLFAVGMLPERRWHQRAQPFMISGFPKRFSAARCRLVMAGLIGCQKYVPFGGGQVSVFFQKCNSWWMVITHAVPWWMDAAATDCFKHHQTAFHHPFTGYVAGSVLPSYLLDIQTGSFYRGCVSYAAERHSASWIRISIDGFRCF